MRNHLAVLVLTLPKVQTWYLSDLRKSPTNQGGSSSSEVVNKRTQTLSRSDTILKEEAQPLNPPAVRHESTKSRRVCRRDILQRQLREVVRHRHIMANRPAPHLLELGRQHKGVQ